MKLRNIIAFATVMALLAVMAAPFASTVSATPATSPPTTVQVGQVYYYNPIKAGGVIDSDMAEVVDPIINGYYEDYNYIGPDWLQMHLDETAKTLYWQGTPTATGSYNIKLWVFYMAGGPREVEVTWTIYVTNVQSIEATSPPTTVQVGQYYYYNPIRGAEVDQDLADVVYHLTSGEYHDYSYSGPSWLQMHLDEQAGTLYWSGTPLHQGSFDVSIWVASTTYGPEEFMVHWAIDVGPQVPDVSISMLVGDTFSYKLETSVGATYIVSLGDLSAIGLSLSGDTISGTAKLGKQTVTIQARSVDGPEQMAHQVIEFNVYRVLAIGGTIQPTNVDGQSYSSQITVTDVDPDATGEVTLSLNQAAIDAGFTITRGSETSWALTRTSAAFVSGEVPITITATTNAGGIQQTRTLTGTVNSYYDVKFITTPSGHRGTGLNVWLVEGDGVWTYRPEARPAGTTISVSGLVSGITWSGGVLTVSPTAPLDTTTVTITATSPDGYSSTTQVLTITVWDKLVFTSRPSVENIITTVDGRNVTATAQASYYVAILWDMGDGTTYEGSETITHEYAEYGQYTITATALHALGYTAAKSVDVSIRPPSVTDGLKDMGPFVAIIGALFVMIMLFAMMRG